MFSLESPHRGDSNEYTQYTVFNIKKKITLNYPKSAAMEIISKGLKNEFETSVVNEPSVFEPLTFYLYRLRSRYALMLSRFTPLFPYQHIQWNFNGSNTDGSFTTAVSNSFLSPLEKSP